jgi:hypothetical protein
MHPELICTGVEIIEQNTEVESKIDGKPVKEVVTRPNMVVALRTHKPTEGQRIMASVVLVYDKEPFPLFEETAIYQLTIEKKKLVAEKPKPVPAPTPPAPAPAPAPAPSSTPTPGLTSTSNPAPISSPPPAPISEKGGSS